MPHCKDVSVQRDLSMLILTAGEGFLPANLLPAAALAAGANASGAELDWPAALPPHAAPASLLLCVVVCTCLLLCAPAAVVCACLLLKTISCQKHHKGSSSGLHQAA